MLEGEPRAAAGGSATLAPEVDHDQLASFLIGGNSAGGAFAAKLSPGRTAASPRGEVDDGAPAVLSVMSQQIREALSAAIVAAQIVVKVSR